jgi:hypothetical protein
MSATTEKVQFRLLHMPCCKSEVVWINLRRPIYCPECGKNIFDKFPSEQWHAQFSPAWLHIEAPEKAYL